MNIRQAQRSDFPAVMSIIRQTQQDFRQAGIDQWQNNYPNLDSLATDLAANTSFVVEENQIVCAYVSLAFTPDKNYTKIDEGNWTSDAPHGVIHRLAVSADYRRQGVALCVLAYAEKTARQKGFSALRADTHQENIPMQKLLLKNGFNYRGIIYIDGVSKRLAFEKLFFPCSLP